MSSALRYISSARSKSFRKWHIKPRFRYWAAVPSSRPSRSSISNAVRNASSAFCMCPVQLYRKPSSLNHVDL